MKTAFVLSTVMAVAGFFYHTNKTVASSAREVVSYKATKARRVTDIQPVAPIRIEVSKSDYELKVYDARGWYATYPVVFGNSSLADKCMEGDRCTPEGSFKIVNKRVHNKWDRYMGLDYPTKESLARFYELKKQRKIPASATPGAGVGIHGTWPHDDYMIDRYTNWTNGCISLKNADIEDLYSYIPLGTPVYIKK